MARPGTLRSLDSDLEALRRLGIALVVTLAREPLPPATLHKHGLSWLHLPVPDFSPPGQQQLLELVLRVRDSVDSGKPVVLHCRAGLGRTGTGLAACEISRGLSAAQAIGTIRLLRPGSVETPGQEAALRRFQDTWRSRGGPSPDDAGGASSA